MDQREVRGRRVKVSWAQFKGNGQRGGGNRAENYRIWVGRIGSNTNESQLRNLFEEYGDISDVKIRSNDKDTFAFIQFTSQRAALRAITGMNNTRFRGNTIKCDWAQYKNRNNNQINHRNHRNRSPGFGGRSNPKLSSSNRRRSRSYSSQRGG